MARRKKELVELDGVEELETSSDESAENETNEAELLNDSQTRNISLSEVEAVAEESSEEVEAKDEEDKPKRQRRSRRKPAETEAVGTEIASETKTEKNLKKEMDAACKAIENSMESMVKQWSAVKEVTTTITQNLEKISTQVQSKTGQSLDEFLLPKKEEKPSFLTKFAICASVVATLLSVLSLTMSQNARQSIISAELSKSASQSVASSQNNNAEVAYTGLKKSEKVRSRR